MKGLTPDANLVSNSEKSRLAKSRFFHIWGLDYPPIERGSISQSIIFPNLRTTPAEHLRRTGAFCMHERSECITKCGSCLSHNHHTRTIRNKQLKTDWLSSLRCYAGLKKSCVGQEIMPVGALRAPVGTPFYCVGLRGRHVRIRSTTANRNSEAHSKVIGSVDKIRVIKATIFL